MSETNPPVPGRVYPLVQVYDLDIEGVPRLLFVAAGRVYRVRTDHLYVEEELTLRDWRCSRWRFVNTTEYGMPVFEFAGEGMPPVDFYEEHGTVIYCPSGTVPLARGFV